MEDVVSRHTVDRHEPTVVADRNAQRTAILRALASSEMLLPICHNFPMCGRYRLSRRKQIIEEHFDTISGEEDWLMHDHENKPEYRVLYNLSNALIVVCDGLRHLEEKAKR